MENYNKTVTYGIPKLIAFDSVTNSVSKLEHVQLKISDTGIFQHYHLDLMKIVLAHI